MPWHPDGSRAPGHAQARREGGKTPGTLGQESGFLAGWLNTTASGRKHSAGTLTTDSLFPCFAGVWVFALIGAS